MACRAIEMSSEKEKRTCPRSGNLYIGPFFSGDAPVEGKGRPIVRWVP